MSNPEYPSNPERRHPAPPDGEEVVRQLLQGAQYRKHMEDLWKVETDFGYKQADDAKHSLLVMVNKLDHTREVSIKELATANIYLI